VARLARCPARPQEQPVLPGSARHLTQRILRPANVSTRKPTTFKSAADDVRAAMRKLENRIAESAPDTFGTPDGHPKAARRMIQ